jgi:hypothetical protein
MHRAARRRALALLVGALAVTPLALRAQQRDTTRRDSTQAPGDSVPRFERIRPAIVGAKAPISARKAFLYSFLVPGLGQARLDRPNGGALFAGIEMGAILMAFKSRDDLRYAERAAPGTLVEEWRVDAATGLPARDSLGRLVPADTALNRYASRLRARKLHFEDWIAVLAFNHLFSGADAFVAAQLWDMPVRGSLRAIGPRAAMLGATVEFGRRRPR